MNSRHVQPKQQFEMHTYEETLGLQQCEVLVKNIPPKTFFYGIDIGYSMPEKHFSHPGD